MEGDSWKGCDVREQSERECGIRVCMYMWFIKESITKMNQPQEILYNIHKKFQHEKRDLRANIEECFTKFSTKNGTNSKVIIL